MSIHIYSAAKLNLTLRIVGRREDGYHEIRSLFYSLPAVESLTITPLYGHNVKDEIAVEGEKIFGKKHSFRRSRLRAEAGRGPPAQDTSRKGHTSGQRPGRRKRKRRSAHLVDFRPLGSFPHDRGGSRFRRSLLRPAAALGHGEGTGRGGSSSFSTPSPSKGSGGHSPVEGLNEEGLLPPDCPMEFRLSPDVRGGGG